MKLLLPLPWLAAGVLGVAGCSNTEPPKTEDVRNIPRSGVGTFGGPGAFGGGGQKPATPTAPISNG